MFLVSEDGTDCNAVLIKEGVKEMKSDSIIKTFGGLLDEEVEWCKENQISALSDEFQKGFIGGLRQAKIMLEQYEEIFDDLIDDIIADDRIEPEE